MPNGTSAGLSNVLRSSLVTDGDFTKCENGGAMINGTNYQSRRVGVCQGRPDFTPPVTVRYTSSDALALHSMHLAIMKVAMT